MMSIKNSESDNRGEWETIKNFKKLIKFEKLQGNKVMFFPPLPSYMMGI